MPHHLVGAVVLLEELRQRREVGDLPRGWRDVELWLPLILGDDDDAGRILPQAGEDLLAVLAPPAVPGVQRRSRLGEAGGRAPVREEQHQGAMPENLDPLA